MDELDDKQLEKISAGKQEEIINGSTTVIVEQFKTYCDMCHKLVYGYSNTYTLSEDFGDFYCYEDHYSVGKKTYCKDCYNKIKE